MKSTVIDTINKFHMIKSGDRVLCALSGGGDSVCMTHILACLRQKLHIELAAAHYSHGLRPQEAVGELVLCQRLCDSLGIELFHETGDTADFCRKNGMSTEQGARELRYDFLSRMGEKWGADKIATAHNRGDNAETVLLNLLRGSGMQGLCGIPPVRDKFIRPILQMPKGEIEQYNLENNLEYATDKTNSENNYARNKIRNVIFPMLADINAQTEKNIANAALLLRTDMDYLNMQAEKALDHAQYSKTSAKIEICYINDAHPAVGARIAAKLCRSAILKPHIDGILALCAGNDPSAQINLPQNLVARRENKWLVIDEAGENAPLPMVRLKPETPIIWGDYQVELWDAEPGGEFDAIAYIEAQTPIFVRPRQVGDRICLSGGSKTIKKYMIDAKIPQKNRDRLPIICNNKRVVAVLHRREKCKDANKRAVTARRIRHE